MAYFLFQHFLNSIYLPNDSLLECAVVFVKYSGSVVPLIFPPKNSSWGKMGLYCINFAESHSGGGKWDREDFSWKCSFYIIIVFKILFLHPIIEAIEAYIL